MAQESKKLDTSSSQETRQDNLVNMQAGSKETQVLEINRQMSSLESSIDKLGKKLNSTNRQIKSDVKRLSNSDAEITDKVADTYKQLGVIENTFQELNTQSSQIASELKEVNSTIKVLEKETSDSLNLAIDSQATINEEFKQSHVDLISRAESLSRQASSISKKLDKSIKENSKAVTQLEVKIVSELEAVAQTSENRDNKLDKKIKSANKEISSQKAKMLLMQNVDEALDKRASVLEDTSRNLIRTSEELQDSTDTLDVLTAKLSSDVEALEMHTARLAQQNAEQQSLIDGQGRTLLALATLENKHFKTLASASLLLLLVIAGSFFYSEYQRESESSVEALRNSAVNDQIAGLQNQVIDEQMASQIFYEEITGLEKTIDQMKSEMVHMNDQVESIDGRVQYIAPLYNFGPDNTIHGSKWLSKLDANQKAIRIATVSDKQELYEIAQRYNHYFTEDLAYFNTADNQYTLIYGGKFETDQQILNIIRRMPRYMNNQLISPISNAEILKQIDL